MSIKKAIIEKASVANVIAAVAILGGLVYGFWTRNDDIINFTVGAAVGYLLKLKTE